MLRSVRYFIADLGHWIAGHRLVAAVVVAAFCAGAGAGAYVLATAGDEPDPAAPAPRVVVREVAAGDETEDAEETSDLGFPAFATKNTTRVAGPDAIADAAAVALAVDPATGGVPGPEAVSLVDAADWPAGIAAASLVADPVGAPMLVTESGELPALTESALRALAPSGSSATAGRQAFVIGEAAEPGGLDTLSLEGANPAELAVEIADLRRRLAGKPEHVLLASSDEPALAMPAAGWAARSGDPVLYVQRDSVPEPTARALRRYEGIPAYVLGPESAISNRALKQIEKAVGADVERVGAPEPVENAIEFARFQSGSFGWNINDPGHGFVIARDERPLDAGAAAPLSASGTWGPLLVTDDGASLPEDLRGYLLDLKPGYESDPTRALYNHVWLIGDPDAISVDFQAQVDELAEVAPVRSGSGEQPLVPGPGVTESQPEPERPGGGGDEPRTDE